MIAVQESTDVLAESGDGLARFQGIRPLQLAKELDVAPNTVYKAIRAGELKTWKFGRAIVIPTQEVDRWLASKAA